MPSRGSPNGALHTLHSLSTARSPGRDRPEQVVVIDWNGWSSSIGTRGRHHPVRADTPRGRRGPHPMSGIVAVTAILATIHHSRTISLWNEAVKATFHADGSGAAR